jgi:hypothetical protein
MLLRKACFASSAIETVPIASGRKVNQPNYKFETVNARYVVPKHKIQSCRKCIHTFRLGSSDVDFDLVRPLGLEDSDFSFGLLELDFFFDSGSTISG